MLHRYRWIIATLVCIGLTGAAHAEGARYQELELAANDLDPRSSDIAAKIIKAT